MKKFLLFIIILIICAIAFTVNKTYQSIDDLAYVIALGVDIGDTNNMKVSFQIAIPSGSEGSGGSPGTSSGSSNESNTIITVEASSISNARTLVNTYLSKELNLSHCKALVISETYAAQGISDILYTLANDIQTRPDCHLMISSCDAKSILENSSPFLESLPSKYYEINSSSSKYTGYSPETRIDQFLFSLSKSFGQPYAILCNVNAGSDDISQQDAEHTNIEKDTNVQGDSIEIQSDKSGIIINGTTVFHGDKLVGELNAIETLCHLIVTNDLRDCTISIKDPFHENATIDLAVTLNKSTDNKVDIINGSPYIQTTVNMKATILSMGENTDYTNEENLKIVSESVNHYLQSQIASYLYKTSKEYKSDIAGFGKKVVKKFATWQEWEEYNWLSQYQNAFFDVNVNTNVKSGHLLIKA